MILYNEIDPYPAEWLRRLSRAGRIARGDVIEGDIRDIHPEDVLGAVQFHAFAGIGVWSHALRRAGWPDWVPVWTGSCPCQPFSVAGRRRGTADARHLWPEWLRLIKQCQPAVCFGEQVGSPDGRAWLDTVLSQLEALGYAVGAADTGAASVGAPHLRQRLFFVALADVQRCERIGLQLRWWRSQPTVPEAGGRCPPGFMANNESGRWPEGRTSVSGPSRKGGKRFADNSAARLLGNTCSKGGGRYTGAVPGAQGEGAGEGSQARGGTDEPESASAARRASSVLDGFWQDAEWIPCQDGKWRPVKPGSFPLADGAAGRVVVARSLEGAPALTDSHEYSRTGALKALGNAIVAPVAEVFIRSVMDLLMEKT